MPINICGSFGRIDKGNYSNVRLDFPWPIAQFRVRRHESALCRCENREMCHILISTTGSSRNKSKTSGNPLCVDVDGPFRDHFRLQSSKTRPNPMAHRSRPRPSPCPSRWTSNKLTQTLAALLGTHGNVPLTWVRRRHRDT
jgi:hypothetical protein